MVSFIGQGASCTPSIYVLVFCICASEPLSGIYAQSGLSTASAWAQGYNKIRERFTVCRGRYDDELVAGTETSIVLKYM